jgi:hypothetical protein
MMSANRGGGVDASVELLQLARAGDGQQSGEGDLTIAKTRPS